jgi:hypothetical protein
MKTLEMKPILVLFVSVLLVIISNGCASAPKSAVITAQRDSHYSLSRSNAISVALRPNPSPENALLGAVLMAELYSEHFNITTNADAEYVLNYLVEDNSNVVFSQHEIVQPVFAAPPQSTGAFLGGQPNNQGDIYRVHTVSTPLVFTDKGIRLYLFTNPKKQPHGFQFVWQGYIGGSTSITAERLPFLVKSLLCHFGEDYNGKIDLAEANQDLVNRLKH